MTKILIKKVINKLAKNGTTKLCSIKSTNSSGQDVWISGFGNLTTESWRDGQTVELEIYQEEYNGEMRLKFQEPVERSVLGEIDKINVKIDEIRAMIYEMVRPATLNVKTSPQAPQEEKTAFRQEVEDLASSFGGQVINEKTPPEWLQ